MSWLAISDGQKAYRLPDQNARNAQYLLTSGSLVIETAFVAEANRPQTVIHLDRTSGWHRSFRVTLRAEGEVFIEHRQNRATTYALLRLRRPDRDAALRLTYAWNGPGRQGLLTVENLDNGRLDQATFDDPQPWPIEDISALISGQSDCVVDPNVDLIAFSDEVEPVGLPQGLVANALVDSAAGPRKVQDLKPGDLIQTVDRGLLPVRWVVSREVPAFGRFAPIHLRAPYFGLDRDLSLSPEHRILIAGADAEYLFGADAVLVESRHLARMAAAPRFAAVDTVRYVHVILDSHECISVSGAWAESLYLGNLADRPAALATSVLSTIPAHWLPRHTRVASPLLESYEAVVLVSALCA